MRREVVELLMNTVVLPGIMGSFNGFSEIKPSLPESFVFAIKL